MPEHVTSQMSLPCGEVANRASSPRSGFSLIQLSVIVLAGGLVAAAMLPEPDGESRASLYMKTIKRMQKIDEATLKHMMALEGRRPCPASGEYYPTHAQFGREDGSPGDCADSGVTDGIITPFDDANIVGGTVPVIDLHLPYEYYFDGWGRPFTYVVDKRATDALECVQTQGGGEVEFFATDGGAAKGKSFYTIISHGPDGYGAFQPGGSTRANRLNTGSTDADQLNNTGASGFSFNWLETTGPNPSYFFNEWIKKETNATYDDVVHYSEKYRHACCIGNKCSQSIAALVPPISAPFAITINGIDMSDGSGASVSSGDVNGDGKTDVIIGAGGADPMGRSGAGEVYVVFGKASGWTAGLNLSSLDGSNGFVLNGIDADDRSGYSVSSGDVNGDGKDDVIVGAPHADPNSQSDAGETYVVFGKASGWTANL
ncbi:MAG: FG-GAP repeat protein, partial [Planctomycetales bacterium]|nr:FG-GAP repeat protein [Planctomycetales bacterium]